MRLWWFGFAFSLFFLGMFGSNVSSADEIERLEKKLEYLKARELLVNELNSIQEQIENLDEQYQDLAEETSLPTEQINTESEDTSIQDNSSSDPPDVSSNNTKIHLEVGPQVKLLGDLELGITVFPDMAIAVMQQTPTLRLLLAATEEGNPKHSSYLLEGAWFENLTSATKVLEVGASGEFDSGYAGISGAYKHSDGTWYAFYHGEDRENMPPIPIGGLEGYYGTIGAASSTDDGRTWEKLGPIITSNKPKGWTAYDGQFDSGAGIPGFVVSKNGDYLYAYYYEMSRVDGRGAQTCLARSRISDGPPLPGTWEKYYNGTFGEPGLGGKDTPVMSGTVFAEDGFALGAHPVYSKELDKYIMVVNIGFASELDFLGGKLSQSGIYFSFSDDAISWAKPEPLIIDHAVPQYGRSLSWEATIVWDEGSSTNGWLIYAYTPAWGADRYSGYSLSYMVGRRVTASSSPY